MNTSTGHLVDSELLQEMAAADRGKYTPVPAGLEPAARRALGGRRETHVDLRGKSELAAWARQDRRERRRREKAGRKAARKGRR